MSARSKNHFVFSYNGCQNKSCFTFFQGRTFQGLIEYFLARNAHLNVVLLEKYQSHRVRRTYENALKSLEKTYPQYLDELKGIADGAKVPFFKVSLIHCGCNLSKQLSCL